MEEIWKDIAGYEGIYQVSNLGRVKSLGRTVTYCNNRQHYVNGSVLRCVLGSKGYLQVTLCRNGKRNINVHRLVAETFLNNSEGKTQINHIDGNKANNMVSNLEWCTCSENLKHAFTMGLNCGTRGKNLKVGSENPAAKKVKIVCESGEEFYFGSIIEACSYIGCCGSAFFRGLKRPKHNCKGYKVYYNA